MAYDSARGVTVLFGGHFGDGETWEWDGTSWIQRLVTGPSPRTGHAMAYDTARGVTVLFGGTQGNVRFEDTWEWNGSSWNPQVIDGPSPRVIHAMAYDMARSTAVLFGGQVASGRASGDTWGLRPTCTAPLINTHPTPQSPCTAGAPATFSITASGDAPLSYQWRKDHTPLVDEPGHITGSTTATLTVTNTTPSDEGSYDCIVTNGCDAVTSNPAALTVNPADFNTDGLINSQDFFNYLEAFFALQPVADINHDTFINSQDFFDFLTAFFSGC
jgi:hypothetical protein